MSEQDESGVQTGAIQLIAAECHLRLHSSVNSIPCKHLKY